MRAMLDGSVALVVESLAADAHDARCYWALPDFGLLSGVEHVAADAYDARWFGGACG